MAFQFDANPYPFNFFDMKDGQGWEGRTPQGKRVIVWVSKGEYVIQFPDASPAEGVTKPVQFTISNNGAYVLMALLAMHMGIATDETQGNFRTVDEDGMISTNGRGVTSV